MKNTYLKISKNRPILLGAYPQGKNGEVKPVEWLYLFRQNPDTITLVSRYVLDFKKYNDILMGVKWDRCSLRKWLNEDFFNAVFSREEAELILESNNAYKQGGRDPWGSLGRFYSGLDDRVSLLNRNIMEETDVYGTICFPTEYAANEGRLSGDDAPCCYWLTDRGEHDYYAMFVDDSGEVNEKGAPLFNSDMGVRPVITVRTNGRMPDLKPVCDHVFCALGKNHGRKSEDPWEFEYEDDGDDKD